MAEGIAFFEGWKKVSESGKVEIGRRNPRDWILDQVLEEGLPVVTAATG